MRTSRSQYQLLVNFMKRNADIVKYETDLSSKKWGELTRKLNADTTGDSKTVVGWKKVWMDLKTQAKRKSSRMNKEGFVDGSQCRLPLSQLERGVLSVLQPPGAAGMVATTKIKLEVPEVQTESPAEELISSNCCRFPLTVQPYQGSTQQTQNIDIPSRLQNSPVPLQQIKTEFPLSPIAREMQIVPVQPKTREQIETTSGITSSNMQQQINTEFPISPVEREMQIVPTQPNTREQIRTTAGRRCTASRRRRWCPYKRQGPPALMSAPLLYADQFNHATEYLRLWSWQLQQNERFLDLYCNYY